MEGAPREVYDGFTDKNIMCSVGANVSLEFNPVRPKGFHSASTNHLPAGGLFQFLYGTLGSIFPQRVRFGLLDATISILAFLLEPTQGLFLGATNYHFRGYTVVLKQQQEQIVSITFQFHWMRPAPMESGRVDL